MRQFISCLLIAFLLGCCNTNPPTSADVTPTGNISLKVRIDNSTNLLPENKTVLLESFTNTGCFPCPVTNRIIKQLTNETYGKSKLITVKFPVNFPAPNDIFYLTAKPVCDFRMDYYDVFYAPTIIIDGLLKPVSSDSLSIKAAIDSRLNNEPKFNIRVTSDIEGDYTIHITIGILDSAGLNLSQIVINTAVIETEIKFERPPGSNGEKEFYNVVRLMLPTVNGISMRRLIDQGEQLFQFKDAILSDWNPEKLNTVVYIQNSITKEIYQSGSALK